MVQKLGQEKVKFCKWNAKRVAVNGECSERERSLEPSAIHHLNTVPRILRSLALQMPLIDLCFCV